MNTPIWLVAHREISMKLRSKAFLISTGVLMLAILASILVGGLLSASSSAPKVAVVSSTASVVGTGTPGSALEVTEAASVDDAQQLVRDGSVDAAILPSGTVQATGGATVSGGEAIPGQAALDYEVVALDSSPSSILPLLSVQPSVVLLEPSSNDGFLTYLIGIAFGLVFFMSAITFGTTIAQSVVEEKQTRVVEILLSTITARQLMAGKVIGNSILAFGQVAVIAVISGIGLTATGQSALFGTLGPAIAWFVVFFVFGFVLLAALYAATAALVSRQEDVGSVTSPVTMLVMLPYFLVIFFNSNPTVMAVMSYVPFSAPVGMPLRLFLGDAEWWEPLLSLAVLLASTAIVIAIGSRMYSNSLLRTGSRVKLREALRG
ncbi:MAG: ABC transporter permease [Herbiconiux sp.]|uniref:ABC transporter permease n=1 Tax=Herbiconiux sp. TaxID=1871186 RepID=UPI0012150497|nr:ABC transporter permease [Herbiconiux sp.]TAJ48436.1 MAG: ABC transporter permease [Herbiconiux sp.]